MSISALATLYASPNGLGQSRFIALEPGDRMLAIRSMTIHTQWPSMWGSIDSCRAWANLNEDTVLIAFSDPYNGYWAGPNLDFVGGFEQVRNPSSHTDAELENFEDGVLSAMLIAGSRIGEDEFAVSFRSATRQQWISEVDAMVSEINGSPGITMSRAEPRFTWAPFPDRPGLNEALIYLRIDQILYSDLDLGDAEFFVDGKNTIYLSAFISVGLMNGGLAASVVRIDVNVGGDFSNAMQGIVQNLVNCQLPTINTALAQALAQLNNALQAANIQLSEVYMLPGDQVRYSDLLSNIGVIQWPAGAPDVSYGVDNRLRYRRDAVDDVTIVLVVN